VSVPAAVRAITLDLDDTLWPVWPAIERAEAALQRWFEAHAPAVAQRYDAAAMRALRDAVARDNPHWSHDLSRIRHHSVQLALRHCQFDEALADLAFEAFLVERNTLDLYEDVLPALRRLQARYPLLAVTNGNADLQRAGLASHFVGVVSAREFGVAKPDARIYAEACRRLGLQPHEVLHVGDSWALDVEAARAAGLQAVWLNRGGPVADAQRGTWTVSHLGEVADALAP
jgi:putative hydrolase of the HAD superfamily